MESSALERSVCQVNPRYSIWSLTQGALSQQRNVSPAWPEGAPKTEYDIVLIGGGGRGLATAYYLAKNHGIRNVAVLERAWIGGGNTGRNTTVVRSNYLYPESARLYEFSLQRRRGPLTCLCPGPYSMLESMPARLVARYLKELQLSAPKSKVGPS